MPDAFYIYCIGERDALAPLVDEKQAAAIEPQTELELIASDELAAVASVVPLSDYGEEAFAARLVDAAWVAARAMRHEKVLEHFASRASIVPLRFGAIYLKRAGVTKMLSEKSESLRALLRRLRDKEEWGVNIFCDRAKLIEMIATLSPALREMSARADASTAGQAYLLRKKIEGMRADEARGQIRRVVAEIESKLKDVSAGAVRLRLRQAETAEHQDLAAKLAFLIERARFTEFRAAAEELAASHAPAGFRLELTGAWPPYNFVEDSGEKI